MNATRRNVMRGAAWTVPVVTIASVAPAYAASAVICTPTGCKFPGDGPHTKDYAVSLNCSSGQPVTSVTINGHAATQESPGSWILRNQTDSESTLFVKIVTADGGEWSGRVKFVPCG